MSLDVCLAPGTALITHQCFCAPGGGGTFVFGTHLHGPGGAVHPQVAGEVPLVPHNLP